MSQRAVHFISDLHLSPKRPSTSAAFAQYIAGPAKEAGALHVLGDLFDAWPGDDALVEPAARAVAGLLASLKANGTEVFFMAGNRDFLIDKDFAQAAQLTLLSEPHEIQLGDTRTLLMHGDSLCTDDVEYQRFRTMVRNPQWRAAVLAKPLTERLAMAAEVRMQSESAKQEKSAEIMDVNAEAVVQALRAAHYPQLIHGHTHRPQRHVHQVDGHECLRWVLHDWHDHAQWLEWTPAAGLQYRHL